MNWSDYMCVSVCFLRESINIMKYRILAFFLMIYMPLNIFAQATIELKPGKNISDQLKASATYVVSEKIDLKGTSLSIPGHSVIKFMGGGSIVNGRVMFNETKIVDGDHSILIEPSGSIDGEVVLNWFVSGNKLTSTDAERLKTVFALSNIKYVLDDDIESQFSIEIEHEHDILLDGYGHTVKGNTNRQAILFKSGKGNENKITVQNITITNALYGLSMSSSAQEVNFQNIQMNNVGVGIYLNSDNENVSLNHSSFDTCEYALYSSSRNTRTFSISDVDIRNVRFNSLMNKSVRTSTYPFYRCNNGGIYINHLLSTCNTDAYVKNVSVQGIAGTIDKNTYGTINKANISSGKYSEKWEPENGGISIKLKNEPGNILKIVNCTITDLNGVLDNNEGNEGLVARAYNVTCVGCSLRDAGTLEGMLYCKGSTIVRIDGCVFEATDTYREHNPNACGVILDSGTQVIKNCTFRNLPFGVYNRSAYATIDSNVFLNVQNVVKHHPVNKWEYLDILNNRIENSESVVFQGTTYEVAGDNVLNICNNQLRGISRVCVMRYGKVLSLKNNSIDCDTEKAMIDLSRTNYDKVSVIKNQYKNKSSKNALCAEATKCSSLIITGNQVQSGLLYKTYFSVPQNEVLFKKNHGAKISDIRATSDESSLSKVIVKGDR